VPPLTSAGNQAFDTSMNSRRNNTVGLLQNKARTVLASDQQRSSTTSLQRRNCLPVSHDSLWIRLNVAEPPFAAPVPTVDGWSSTKRVVLAANIDRRPRAAIEQPRRRRRDVDNAIGGGRLRTRTRTTTSHSSPSPSTTGRLQVATDGGTRRRRTVATVAQSEISTSTPTSIFTTGSEPTTVRSRPINVTPATTNARPLLPEINETMTDKSNDGGDGGDSDDVIAAAFRQTSWQCRSEPYWRRMPAGTFPPYIQTARCRQTRCMLGMYECVARRYGVKVLRRVDGRCLPVPVIAPVNTTGNTTTSLNREDVELDLAGGAAMYEQAWALVETQVVIGCDCAKRRDTGAFYG